VVIRVWAADSLAGLPLGGADLSTLLQRFDQHFEGAAARDRATLFRVATEVARSGRAAGIDLSAPLLLLDVPLDSALEFELVRALLTASRQALVTVPFGDIAALDRISTLTLVPEVLVQVGESDLVALRRHLFARTRLEPRTPAGDVRFFSAPGEGRECVEIARRILDESRAGIRFDEIAVFVRSPQRYAGLLEHAFGRVRRRTQVTAHGVSPWHPGLLRSRHSPPASGRPRIPRHPRVRLRKALGTPLRRIPLPGPGADSSATPARVQRADPRRRGARWLEGRRHRSPQ
jgi:hypothetical protein